MQEQEKQYVENTGFRPMEELEVKITGQDLTILDFSIESMFNNNIQAVRPVKYKYFDKKDNVVLKPTLEQIENKELTRVFDALSFMSPNNVIYAYIGDISPAVLEAQKVIGKMHEQGIEQGKATLVTELITEQEELNKSKLEVVEEA
jgi:hypothetical protein